MLLSIVIPVHNNPELIQRCLESVMPEIVSNFVEVIVVNDQSDEETVQVLKQCSDSIKVVNTKQREGVPGPCRNLGASAATGDYIWCIDYDDVILHGAIQIALDLIQKYQTYDIIYLGQLSYQDQTFFGTYTEAVTNKFDEAWQIPTTVEAKFTEGFFTNGPVRWYCCPWMFFYRRSIFEKQQFTKYAAEDLEFFIRAIGSGFSICNVRSCLYRKLNRPDSLFYNLNLEQAFGGVVSLLNTTAEVLNPLNLDYYTKQRLLFTIVSGPVLDFINSPNLSDPDKIQEYVMDHLDDIRVTDTTKAALINFFLGMIIRGAFSGLTQSNFPQPVIPSEVKS